MPCNDWPQESASEREYRKEIDKLRDQGVADKSKLDQLVAMLCSTCRELEERGFDFAKNPVLDSWWHEHKLQDLKRKEREQNDFISRVQKAEERDRVIKLYNQYKQDPKSLDVGEVNLLVRYNLA